MIAGMEGGIVGARGEIDSMSLIGIFLVGALKRKKGAKTGAGAGRGRGMVVVEAETGGGVEETGVGGVELNCIVTCEEYTGGVLQY
jgi:hypothetical protein